MSGLGGDFAVRFARETWALYAVGVLGAVLRYTARVRRLGVRNLQADDYLMLNAVLWYTILCVALNQVASGGGSNLMTQEEIDNITPQIHAERERGSKWVFVSEHAFILCVWSLKACMLVIYARITEGLRQRKWINWIAIYVVIGFVATELSLFLICRPLSAYWAVPTSNYQCSSYQYYEIVQGCLSISADIFMLLVAIPMMVQVRVPLKQKMILIILFGMGIFVIVSAILNKIYCLVPSLISYVYMNWYFREATVAILVTNLPLVWSLLRDVFPALKSWTGGSKRGTDRYKSQPWTNSKNSRPYGPQSQLRSGDFNMQDFHTASVTPTKAGPAVSDVSLEASDDRDMSSDDGSARALRIRQDITVTVEHDTRPPTYESNHSGVAHGHEAV